MNLQPTRIGDIMASLWQWTYLRLAIVAALLTALHIAEDYVLGAQQGETNLAVGAIVVGLLLVFGLIWSAEGRTSGYWIVGIVLLIQGFLFTYVFHGFEIGGETSFVEIASEAGGWGPVFVLGDILAGITSLSVVIMAVYLAVRPDARDA